MKTEIDFRYWAAILGGFLVGLLLFGCTAEDVPEQVAKRYDIVIYEDLKIEIQSKSGHVFNTERQSNVLVMDKNISGETLNKYKKDYPEGTVTMHEPLPDGRLRVVDQTITHDITTK